MRQLFLFIIGFLLFSGCGNTTVKQNPNADNSIEFVNEDYNQPLLDSSNIKRIKIEEDIFIKINNENYPEESCLTIIDKQINILFQQCYESVFIEICEQENPNILTLVFISGKSSIDVNVKYINDIWIAETVRCQWGGIEQPKKKITVNLEDFNFGDILEKWNK